MKLTKTEWYECLITDGVVAAAECWVWEGDPCGHQDGPGWTRAEAGLCHRPAHTTHRTSGPCGRSYQVNKDEKNLNISYQPYFPSIKYLLQPSSFPSIKYLLQPYFPSISY